MVSKFLHTDCFRSFLRIVVKSFIVFDLLDFLYPEKDYIE